MARYEQDLKWYEEVIGTMIVEPTENDISVFIGTPVRIDTDGVSIYIQKLKTFTSDIGSVWYRGTNIIIIEGKEYQSDVCFPHRKVRQLALAPRVLPAITIGKLPVASDDTEVGNNTIRETA